VQTWTLSTYMLKPESKRKIALCQPTEMTVLPHSIAATIFIMYHHRSISKKLTILVASIFFLIFFLCVSHIIPPISHATHTMEIQFFMNAKE
jgi:ATP/ADP translocase